MKRNFIHFLLLCMALSPPPRNLIFNLRSLPKNHLLSRSSKNPFLIIIELTVPPGWDLVLRCGAGNQE